MSTKTFDTATILSVTTDRFLCKDIGQIYEILNHVTGDNLFTHVLPRAGRFSKPYLIEANPALDIPDAKVSELDAVSEMPRELVRPFIDKWLSSFNLPASYEVDSHEDAWMSLDPVSELRGMVGDDKIIVA